MDSKKLVARALEVGQVVPAFNIPHLPMVKPIAQAVADENSIAMIQVARLEWEKFQSASLERVRTTKNMTSPALRACTLTMCR